MEHGGLRIAPLAADYFHAPIDSPLGVGNTPNERKRERGREGERERVRREREREREGGRESGRGGGVFLSPRYYV